MTADTFRKMALEYPGAVESSHMNHPDFRAGGRIFSTLGFPDENWGMLKLTPEQQLAFVSKAPAVFNPCNGAWGRNGATNVHLASATKSDLKPAFDAAWTNATTKPTKSASSKRNPAARQA